MVGPANKQVWSVGESAVFGCGNNHELVGQRIAQCTAFGSFSVAIPICRPIGKFPLVGEQNSVERKKIKGMFVSRNTKKMFAKNHILTLNLLLELPY